MEVTRNVIMDLLPLYLAEEASADTRALVQEHLENDPELARAARELMGAASTRDVPVPLTKEAGMEALLEVKRLQYRRTVLFTVTGAALGIVVPLVIAAIYLLLKG